MTLVGDVKDRVAILVDDMGDDLFGGRDDPYSMSGCLFDSLCPADLSLYLGIVLALPGTAAFHDYRLIGGLADIVR